MSSPSASLPGLDGLERRENNLSDFAKEAPAGMPSAAELEQLYSSSQRVPRFEPSDMIDIAAVFGVGVDK